MYRPRAASERYRMGSEGSATGFRPFGPEPRHNYTHHRDQLRRAQYRTRHAHDRVDDPFAPGFWSWWHLWGPSADSGTAFRAAVRRAKSLAR